MPESTTTSDYGAVLLQCGIPASQPSERECTRPGFVGDLAPKLSTGVED
jgi:hypothetical protein